MPTAVVIDGRTTRRPGVYATVNAESLAGNALTTNTLAVVGDFPWLETAKAVRYSSGTAIVADAPPGNALAALVAKFAFSPGADDRISGQPSAVYLMNAGTSAAASITVNDASAAAAKLTSKVFGLDGNKMQVVIAVNATDATLRDVTVNLSGEQETFNGVGSGPVATFLYSGTDATAMTVDTRQSASDILKVSQSRAGITGAFVPAQGTWLWDGTLTVTPSAVPAPGDASLVVNGIEQATGAAGTETISVPNSGGGAPVTGTKSWSAITSLTYTPSAGAETATVEGLALEVTNTDLASYPSLNEVADYLNGFSAQGFSVTKTLPSLASIPLDEVDQTAPTSMLTAAPVRADLWWFVNTLNTQSALVEASQLSTGTGQVAALAATNLSGGSYVTATPTLYEAAFTALEKVNVTTIAVLDDDQATEENLRAHCIKMAGVGSNERNGWVGASSLESFAAIKTRTRALNTRHLSCWGPNVKLRNPSGAVVTYSPIYGALICAAAQCSTAVGTPLTWKKLNIVDVVTNADWDVDQDAEEALENGIVFAANDPNDGLRVERSITTYLTDDNPVYSEMSANESLNTCIRDLRNFLQVKIGQDGAESTADVLKTLANSRLRYQTEPAQDIIKAFNAGYTAVDDLGDVFRVRFQVAVKEPINFIILEANVSRTPFGA